MERISGRFSYERVDGIECKGGRTKQSFAADCDINKIVSRAMKTGILSTGIPGGRVASFGDFSRGEDYMALQVRLRAVNEDFMRLPVSVRAKFNHDPAVMFDWLADDRNKVEAVKLGLVALSATEQLNDAQDAIIPKVVDTPVTPNVGGQAAAQ